MAACGGQDAALVQIELLDDEIIRMHSLHAEGLKGGGGEIPKIEGDDELGASADGCGEDMPVILVGQRQPVYKSFVSGNDSIRHGLMHQRYGAVQIACQFWPLFEKVAAPLLVDLIRPARRKQLRESQPEQKIPGNSTQAS